MCLQFLTTYDENITILQNIFFIKFMQIILAELILQIPSTLYAIRYNNVYINVWLLYGKSIVYLLPIVIVALSSTKLSKSTYQLNNVT